MFARFQMTSQVVQLTRGQLFGELALMGDQPRAGSAQCPAAQSASPGSTPTVGLVATGPPRGGAVLRNGGGSSVDQSDLSPEPRSAN